MGVGRAGMEKIMEVPEGTKSGSSLWFSSPTPRHRYTHGISEQDRCPVWAHLSVRACAHAHARWPARQGVGRGLGIWLESVQAPGLPEASQRSPRWRRDCRSSGVLEAECECGGARGPRGGNPGLQRESGPRPAAPRGPGGAGAAGGIQESGRAAGAKGPLLVGKKPRAPGPGQALAGLVLAVFGGRAGVSRPESGRRSCGSSTARPPTRGAARWPDLQGRAKGRRAQGS